MNDEIQKNIALDISIKNFDVAKSEGAEALFGEKYGDEVRVISIGDFSMELCGGTHVTRTGDIGLLKVIEESSLAAGVRRIVAVTGPEAINYIQKNANIIHELQGILGTKEDEINSRVNHLIDERKELEKKLKHKRNSSTFSANTLMEGAVKINDFNILVSEVESESLDELKGWRYTEVAKNSTRSMKGAKLAPKPGHENSYRVEMSWGDPVTQPIETDVGAVMNDYASLTWVNSFEAASLSDTKTFDQSLDSLFD